MCKENYVKIAFVIDESGSMSSSRNDVIGGFNTFIDEQKKEKLGDVDVSLYTFNNSTTTVFENLNISEVSPLSHDNYKPSGSTALNDAVGTVINNMGKSLSDMEEENRPSTVMVVIMTDGEENTSREFSIGHIKEMIKHQTEKYDWKFVYLGTDITTTKMADDMGIKSRGYSSRTNVSDAMKLISETTTSYRNLDKCCASVMLDEALSEMTTTYETEIGKKIEK